MKGMLRNSMGSWSRGAPETKTKGTCLRSRICAISNVLPSVTSISKKAKYRALCKASCDRPFNHDGSRDEIYDDYFQIHGDPRFIFDNENAECFHGTQPWRSLA